MTATLSKAETGRHMIYACYKQHHSLWSVVLPILMALLLLAPTSVLARCGVPLPNQISRADSVFEGTLLTVARGRMRFRVIAVYKGTPPPEVEVRWTRRSIRGTTRDVGSAFLVMTRVRRNGDLVVAPCSGSGSLAKMGEVLRWLDRLGYQRTPVER